MSDIAKRYVKALTATLNDSELSLFLENLKSLIPPFSNKKFQEILLSRDISDGEKEKFLISLFDNPDKKFVNFLRVLNRNKRLFEVSAITRELSKEIAFRSGRHEGIVVSNFKIDSKDLKEIESSISKKLDTTVELKSILSKEPGIRVEIDSLGVEVGFSSDRFKSQMAEHILKTL